MEVIFSQKNNAELVVVQLNHCRVGDTVLRAYIKGEKGSDFSFMTLA